MDINMDINMHIIYIYTRMRTHIYIRRYIYMCVEEDTDSS
jgi:hypothetical protein